MAEWLVLRLPRESEALTHWLLTDAQGQPLASVQSGALADAAAAATARRVCVLVPAGDVLIAEVELPVRGGARLQQVVPYAMEEQLAADIDTLHFAVGPRLPGSDRTMVAVVARARIDEWLATLAAVGVVPALMCAETAMLPVNPGHTVCVLDGDLLWVQEPGGGAPVALPSNDIAASLGTTLGAEALAGAHLIFYSTPADWQRRSGEVETLRPRCVTLKVQLLSAGLLPLLAPQLKAGEAFNLLQGTYAPQVSIGSQLQRWRLAALLATVLLVLHVGAQALSLWQLKRSERQLDDSIRTVVHAAVPDDPGTGAVRQRLQQRLTSGQAHSDSAGLMSALAALARARGGIDGASLQALSFRDGSLDLKVRAQNAESLEHILEALRADRWQADLTSGATAAGAYEGRLLMRAGTGR